ncbi:MAG TPA: hypothetical protein VGL58_08905 [Caulobacteraceae bacterium]|jgi:hypothetical protein
MGGVKLAGPRGLMLIATAIMLVSEFLNYTGTRTVETSMPIVGGGGGDYVEGVEASATQQLPGISGWTYHPLAIFFLGALVVLFGLNLALPPTIEAWRYRLGFVGLLFCFLPFNLDDGGAGLGLFLGLAALVIAGWTWRSAGKATPAVVAP